ncbi:DUF3368 domain-containing protein [cf. Phormidesmis sp. LEGE 11477]|uniref:DUF3368 domain-containing protein n=1 Tax=cf. Phormidesmis sp. LEGE 11477 TaxID=1828680 RepID=UPI00187FD861|nr:DUF3368 domain-containing protein [cf. Phormidesmis sp. LEGE 11477]MBE9061661.1 DUF3368 domain-containing protein [cf. Phormidesmis sp. LEGE 11477]
MRIVSNTSPISYLVVIGHIDLLPLLFSHILIPETVRDELSAARAPSEVQRWIAEPPKWLRIDPALPCSDSELLQLDAGERAAIQLAESPKADLILLDDLAARLIAARRGIPLTGTLGILDRAATEGEIDFEKAIARLQKTNFRVSKAVLSSLLQRHNNLP